MTAVAVSTQPLGSLIETGYKPHEPALGDEVWNLNLDQIEPHTGRVLSKCMLNASETGPSTYAFDRGTVLYSKLRPYLNKVVVADDDGVATTELVPLRCDESRLNAHYLAHFLRGPDFLQFATNVVAGAKMPRMVMSAFWRFPVPVPPIPEQRRIAAILDQADALRAKRREALAQLDSLTQAIFIEMFGDPKVNGKNWKRERIGALISDMRGGASLEPDDFVESGFPVLHKGAIKPNGGLAFDPKKRPFTSHGYAAVREQSVVNRNFVAVTLRDLVPSGPSIGLATDLSEGPCDQYLLAQGAYGFRVNPSKLTAAFLVQLSNIPTFRYVLKQNAVGSTQIHIRLPIYLNILIPVPPIALQRIFSLRLGVISSVRRSHAAGLLAMDDLFSSLQHRAFTGKLA
jgi:type I restriction enzyme, S subunit